MDHRHATSVLRIRRSAVLVAGSALATAALAGCGLFGGSSNSSYTGAPVAAGSARAGQAATVPSPTATGSAAAASASAAAAASASAAKGAPYVEAIKQKGCTPKTFVEHASLVGGAIHVYITKPLGTGAGSASARTQAASAAAYAAKNLGAGTAAIEGCSTADSLTAISKQNVALLKTLSTDLGKGNVAPTKVQAVDALFADVLTQAKRLNLTIVEKTPSPQELAGA